MSPTNNCILYRDYIAISKIYKIWHLYKSLNYGLCQYMFLQRKTFWVKLPKSLTQESSIAYKRVFLRWIWLQNVTWKQTIHPHKPNKVDRREIITVLDMANAATDFKVKGSRKVVNDLWTRSRSWRWTVRNYGSTNWQSSMASTIRRRESLLKVVLSVPRMKIGRGWFLPALFSTETAWSSCTELFEEINHLLLDELSISLREKEPGC